MFRFEEISSFPRDFFLKSAPKKSFWKSVVDLKVCHKTAFLNLAFVLQRGFLGKRFHWTSRFFEAIVFAELINLFGFYCLHIFLLILLLIFCIWREDCSGVSIPPKTNVIFYMAWGLYGSNRRQELILCTFNKLQFGRSCWKTCSVCVRLVLL